MMITKLRIIFDKLIDYPNNGYSFWFVVRFGMIFRWRYRILSYTLFICATGRRASVHDQIRTMTTRWICRRKRETSSSIRDRQRATRAGFIIKWWNSIIYRGRELLLLRLTSLGRLFNYQFEKGNRYYSISDSIVFVVFFTTENVYIPNCN